MSLVYLCVFSSGVYLYFRILMYVKRHEQFEIGCGGILIIILTSVYLYFVYCVLLSIFYLTYFIIHTPRYIHSFSWNNSCYYIYIYIFIFYNCLYMSQVYLCVFSSGAYLYFRILMYVKHHEQFKYNNTNYLRWINVYLYNKYINRLNKIPIKVHKH